LIKKILVIGIIILFLGTCYTPSVAIENIKNSTIPNSSRNTLYVGGSGEGNYTKIQDAIDDASDGDIVFVYNGTYKEAIDVDKSINLIGEDRNKTKIINEYEDYYAVDISADFVNISGFTIITIFGCERYYIGLISIGSCNNCVSNNVLKGVRETNGIELSGSSNNNTIIGNIIFENGWGICLISSSNNTIKNNNLSHNLCDILLEENCMNNKLSGNTFLETNWCISIGIQSSSNNIIIDNSFSNIWGGGCIELDSSNKNVVMNNTMISVPSGHGIEIRNSKENIIIGNTIKNLEYVSGIYLGSATDNTITSNNLINCNTTGIRSYKKYVSNNNTIHHNNFYNNTKNAYDECDNEWDNGYPSGGNYWDDYTGEDKDGDGIGDSPYNISGGDNQDRYPLMEQWGDNLFPVPIFSWTPSYPDSEEPILFDASQSSDYDGNIILYEWDWNNDAVFDENLSSPTVMHTFEEAGYYPVTLQVTDNDNLMDNKTKTVRVGNHPPDAPTIDGPNSGKPGVVYEFCIIASDPDDDTLFVLWNWGDGTHSDWLGPLESGTEVCDSHSWNKKGTYNISVTVRDEYGESVKAYKEVTIPRTRASSYHWFLERFPILERLLTFLLL